MIDMKPVNDTEYRHIKDICSDLVFICNEGVFSIINNTQSVGVIQLNTYPTEINGQRLMSIDNFEIYEVYRRQHFGINAINYVLEDVKKSKEYNGVMVTPLESAKIFWSKAGFTDFDGESMLYLFNM